MKEGLSTTSAVVTMVTSMMGAGINFMPEAFKNMDTGYGYISGLLAIALIGLLTFFSLYAVGYTASRSKDPNPTYSSLSAPISRAFKVLVDFSVFTCCFGANFSFYRYFAQLVLMLFPEVVAYIRNDYELARKVVVSTFAIPFFLLGCKKNLSGLKITSYITVAAVMYLAVLMVTYSLAIGDKIAPKGVMPAPDFSNAIPYFVLAMACQANMVKVFTELEHKSLKSIAKVALGTSVFGTLVYGLVGMCGYIVFGLSADRSIIDYLIDKNSAINVYLANNTFDKHAVSSRIAAVGAMLVLFGGFPVQLNPLSGIVMNYLRPSDNPERLRIRTVFVLMVSLLALVLATANIDTSTVLKLIGATSINLSSFLYPAVYYIHAKGKMDVMTALAGAMGVLSIVAMFYMTYNIVN